MSKPRTSHGRYRPLHRYFRLRLGGQTVNRLLVEMESVDLAEILDVHAAGQVRLVPGDGGEDELGPDRVQGGDPAPRVRQVAGVGADAPEESPRIGDQVADRDGRRPSG